MQTLGIELADNWQLAVEYGSHSESEYQTRDRHHPTDAFHLLDCLRVESGVDIFFESGDQK